jgi:signal transduction histidine kinase
MGGLYRISYKNRKQCILPFSELNDKPYKTFDLIYEDHDKNIYVKDMGEKLYLLSPDVKKKRDVGTNEVDVGANADYVLKTTFDLPATLRQMAEDSSMIYLGSSEGLFIIHKKDFRLEKSPLQADLPFVSINNLMLSKNKIWLTGNGGLYSYDMLTKTGRLFTVEDGLPSNRFSEFCAATNRYGQYFAGTNNGLLAFYPDKLNDTIYPPRAQLTGIYVNDSARSFVVNPQELSTISLSHDQNTFSFDFSCISFQHASAGIYEYKLDGFDDHWINSGNSHYTRYSRIPPGQYHFHLRMKDARGVISPYTKTLDIEIKKAFWQTTAFILFMAALLILAIWLAIREWFAIKIRKQRRVFERQQAIEKERTRIATDMHDDLGAGLSRIKFLSETIGMKKQMQQPAEEEIQSIAGYANEMIGKMGEIVWALNEKNDSLSDLLSYTRSYAVEYLYENNIDCEVHMATEFPGIFVSGEFRRNIYLAIKEALHNIVKHARANKVVIKIFIDRWLTISIHDDGIGFDAGHIRPFSNGLNNMKKRMTEIGGKLEMVRDKGTTVVLSAPLTL